MKVTTTQEKILEDDIFFNDPPEDRRGKIDEFIRFVERHRIENQFSSLYDAFEDVIQTQKFPGVDMFNAKKFMDKRFTQRLLESAREKNLIKPKIGGKIKR